MDPSKSDNKKGVISKMWKRCKSLGKNTKSLPRRITVEYVDQDKVAPTGSFPIYVGPEKERFVIRTELVNHPLFKNLLEQAESEYGYGNKGPLMLPCQVDHFVDVLMEMDYEDEGIGEDIGCSFVARTHSSYHFLTPPRVVSALAG